MEGFLGIWEEFVNIATLGNSLDKAILSKVSVSFDKNKVLLAVNDEFTKTWVEQNYLDRIKSMYSYYDMEVEIVIKEKTTNQKKTIQQTQNKNEITDSKDKTPLSQKPQKISEKTLDDRLSKGSTKVFTLKSETNEIIEILNLTPHFTFDNFIVGPSNEFAYHAALNVARNPGSSYNPLFIYGGVGLGKTHLLQAIAAEVLKTNKLKKVMYVTSEQFTNDFFKALNSKNMHSFRIKYREADILLIDDVQFFKSSMKQTIEELFHTFNKLAHNRKQMVFTSDRTPRELEEMGDRMISRFESGLVVEIKQPDFETRLKILDAKLSREGISLKDELKAFIANSIVSNVRSLESAINRITAFTSFKKVELTLNVIKTLLKDLIEVDTKEKELTEIIYTPDEIINAVARYYGIKSEDITGNNKTDELILARQIAMYLTKRLTTLSFSQIADKFGKVHSTVMRAYERIESLIKRDILLKEQIKEILSLLKHIKNVSV